MSRRERCGMGRCTRPAPYLLRHLSFWSPVTRDPRSGPLEPGHCRSLPPLSRPPNLEPRSSRTIFQTFSTCKPIPANACGAGNRSLESRTPGTITKAGRAYVYLHPTSVCTPRAYARPPPLSPAGANHLESTARARLGSEQRRTGCSYNHLQSENR